MKLNLLIAAFAALCLGCVDPSPTPSPSPSPTTTVQAAPTVTNFVINGTTGILSMSSNAPTCTVAVGSTQAAANYNWTPNVSCSAPLTIAGLPVNSSKIWVRLYANYSANVSLAADYSFTASGPIPVPSSSPLVSFNPFSASSPWNQALPTNPTLNANSAAMIAGVFQNYSGRFYVNPPGGFPVFTTISGDPTVTISLFEPYGVSNLQGAVVPMPKNVVPAPPSDAHLTVINPTNGTEYDYYEFPQTFTVTPGGAIKAGFGNITNYQTGSGWGGAVTASGAVALAGLVTTAEFQSGQIHHALAMAPACNNGAGSVYPATAVATFLCPVSKGNGIPHGSRIWSDLTSNQVAALKLDKISSILLTALNQYGGFVTDTNGWVAFDIREIFEAPITPAATAYLANNGTIQLNSEPVSFFTSHLHVLAVCVTQGGC